MSLPGAFPYADLPRQTQRRGLLGHGSEVRQCLWQGRRHGLRCCGLFGGGHAAAIAPARGGSVRGWWPIALQAKCYATHRQLQRVMCKGRLRESRGFVGCVGVCTYHGAICMPLHTCGCWELRHVMLYHRTPSHCTGRDVTAWQHILHHHITRHDMLHDIAVYGVIAYCMGL